MKADFEAVWQLWQAFLASFGFVAAPHLNPPAAPERIAAVEAEIGFRLPDDLKQLYLRADGQKATFEIADPAPGTRVAPLFGRYEFVPLEKALANYRMWAQVIDEWPAGDDPHEFITVRGGDPVAREYWRRGWFPFAIDGGGNAYAVDLSPPPGGTYGQVIVIGSDEDQRRVLAPSVTALLAEAGERRPAVDLADGHFTMFALEP